MFPLVIDVVEVVLLLLGGVSADTITLSVVDIFVVGMFIVPWALQLFWTSAKRLTDGLRSGAGQESNSDDENEVETSL